MGQLHEKEKKNGRKNNYPLPSVERLSENIDK